MTVALSHSHWALKILKISLNFHICLQHWLQKKYEMSFFSHSDTVGYCYSSLLSIIFLMICINLMNLILKKNGQYYLLHIILTFYLSNSSEEKKVHLIYDSYVLYIEECKDSLFVYFNSLFYSEYYPYSNLSEHYPLKIYFGFLFFHAREGCNELVGFYWV